MKLSIFLGVLAILSFYSGEVGQYLYFGHTIYNSLILSLSNIFFWGIGRGKLLMSSNDEIKLMRKLSDAFNKNDRSKDVNIVNEM